MQSAGLKNNQTTNKAENEDHINLVDFLNSEKVL